MVPREILDARIPISSRNPDIDAICGQKPRMVVLNRIDLADPALVERWADWFRKRGWAVLKTDCRSRKGVQGFVPVVQKLLADKLARYREKGQAGRPLKLMVVGIPNVGKSTFINQIAGRKGAQAENRPGVTRGMIVGIPNVGKSSFINRISKQSRAKVEDRPGVTRGNQWFTISNNLEMLDTPGMLWPKFDDPKVGLHLAYTGAVKDGVIDTLTLAARLMELLAARYPKALEDRYRMDIPADADGYALLERAGRKRGFLVSGGEVDLDRMANVLLEEYRSCKLGRFTLETPEEAENT